MTLPTYTRYRRYYDAQQASPGTVLNGQDFDTDYDRIKTFADGVSAALALIQRDDGLLKNGSVGSDQLAAEVMALLGGVTPRGDWVTASDYLVGSLVRQSGDLYVARAAHHSGNFASDLAALKWMLLTSAGPTGSAGPAGPASWGAAGAWVTARNYTATAPASLVTSGSETYVCVITHTSGVFATDLAAVKWVKVAAKGATGATGADGANWTAGETYAAPAITAGVLTLALATGTTVFKVQNNANITSLVITGAPAAKASGFLLELYGTGSAYTYAGLKIAGGVLVGAGGAEFPTPTTTSGKKDVFSVWTDDGGTTWNYAVVGQAF